MKYQIICKETKLSQAAQQNMLERMEKIERLLFKNDDLDCRIVVKFRNNRSKVEITIPTPYLLLRSEAEAIDLVDAIEIARSKLISQIDKVKARLDRSKNKVNLGRTFGEPIESTKEDLVVKKKTVYPQPMSEEDAIMQMDSLGHDFYIFEKLDNQKISVIYKRKDGGYGLIDIE